MNLGTEKCATCGKQFTKTGLAQKYCKSCRDKRIRKQQREAQLRFRLKNKEAGNGR